MESIAPIIRQRQRGALTGVSIVMLVTVFALIKDTQQSVAILGTGAVLIVFLIGLFMVNGLNYPTPKPYYRTVNKVFYLNLSRLLIVLSIFDMIVNIKRLLNPLEGFAHEDSKAADALQAGTSGGFAYLLFRRLQPAKTVEQYFATIQQQPLPLYSSTDNSINR